LRAAVGDEVVLASPFDATATPFGLYPKFRKYRVAGIFSSGLYEYDASMVFISLEEAAAFYRLGDASTGIEVRIHDVFAAERMKEQVLDALGRYPYRINTWIELNENLFLWMKLEKVGMGVILLLIVLIAAFNIVGVLVMLVMENTREIGILKSMGASDASIMSIFMTTGTEIGLLGIVSGSILGLAGTWVLDRYPLDLPGDVYFLNSLPVLLSWPDVITVTAVVFVLCALATLYPSWKAARLDPVRAIRSLGLTGPAPLHGSLPFMVNESPSSMPSSGQGHPPRGAISSCSPGLPRLPAAIGRFAGKTRCPRARYPRPSQAGRPLRGGLEPRLPARPPQPLGGFTPVHHLLHEYGPGERDDAGPIARWSREAAEAAPLSSGRVGWKRRPIDLGAVREQQRVAAARALVNEPLVLRQAFGTWTGFQQASTTS
jgi:hypothetical protein